MKQEKRLSTILTPDKVLGILEKAYLETTNREKIYGNNISLILQNETSVLKQLDGQLVIILQPFALTPVRALKWDYLIGDNDKSSKEFLLEGFENGKKYLANVNQTSLRIFSLKKEVTVNDFYLSNRVQYNRTNLANILELDWHSCSMGNRSSVEWEINKRDIQKHPLISTFLKYVSKVK